MHENHLAGFMRNTQKVCFAFTNTPMTLLEGCKHERYCHMHYVRIGHNGHSRKSLGASRMQLNALPNNTALGKPERGNEKK